VSDYLFAAHRLGWHPATVRDEQLTLDGISSATFSTDRVYRYALTRTWWPDRADMTFIMLNPSTADAYQSDATVVRCANRARAAGYNLLVLNLFALRATNPATLRGHRQPVGPDNDAFLAGLLDWSSTESPGPVVAAWGIHGQLHGRDIAVVGMLDALGVRLECLGVTRNGAPRHPLYLRANTPLRPFPGGRS
jgi:hypothetical protein